MHFAKASLRTATFLLLGARHVFASTDGKVFLINATPYNWKQVANHQHLMDWKFPDVIPSGTTGEQNIKFLDFRHCTAETTFTLVGYPTAASFVVQARQQPNRIQIKYQKSLSSLNNPQDSFIDLGFVQDGAVLYILAGNGTDGSPFVSTNPPVAWMQSTLSNIGSKTLREIAMPESHDSGMSQMTHWDGGVPHNSLTQFVNVYQQLVFGARFFDIRPVLSHGKFYTGHYSKVLSSQAGASGRTINDIVKDINRFTSEHPGELIILDLSHDMNRDKGYRKLAPMEWHKLFGILKGINDLWVGSNSAPDDLTTLPLSTFITPGSKSTVLIRIPGSVPLPGHEFIQFSQRDLEATDNMVPSPDADSDNDHDGESSSIDPTSSSTTANVTPTPVSGTTAASLSHLPTSSKLPQATAFVTAVPTPTPTNAPEFYYPAEAFVHPTRLPHEGSYSNTDDANYLATDQLSKLAKFRPGTKSLPLRTTWTLTQRIAHILDVGNPTTSIIVEAAAAHSALFQRLWNSCSKFTYPNIIEVDGIHNSQITALAMGINEYFANGVVDMPKVGDPNALQSRSRLFVSKLRCLSGWGCHNTAPEPAIVSRHVATSIDNGPEKRKQSAWSKALCYIKIPAGCDGGKDENWNPYDAIKNRVENPSNVSIPDSECFLWFKMPKSCFPSTRAEIEAHDTEVEIEEHKKEVDKGVEEHSKNELYREAWFREFNEKRNETAVLELNMTLTSGNRTATNKPKVVEVRIQEEHPKSRWGPRPDADFMPWVLNITSAPAPAPSRIQDPEAFPKSNNKESLRIFWKTNSNATAISNSTISSNGTTLSETEARHNDSPRDVMLKILEKMGCYAGSVTLGFFTNGSFRIRCEPQYQYHGP